MIIETKEGEKFSLSIHPHCPRCSAGLYDGDEHCGHCNLTIDWMITRIPIPVEEGNWHDTLEVVLKLII